MKGSYPNLRNRTNLNGEIRIEVMADSMRVGKTTAVKVIADGLRGMGREVTESYEDWQHNPYLTKSYDDPAQNFLQSQKWFIRRKWEQIRDGGKGVFIQDVSPEMDYCYAETNRRLGRMSQADFQEYHDYYYSLDWSVAPLPDLLIYLSVSDGELLKRAMSSKREFETVDSDYFLMMKRVNREWLAGAKQSKNYQILYLDTDEFDFAHEGKMKSKLLKLVSDRLLKT